MFGTRGKRAQLEAFLEEAKVENPSDFRSTSPPEIGRASRPAPSSLQRGCRSGTRGGRGRMRAPYQRDSKSTSHGQILASRASNARPSLGTAALSPPLTPQVKKEEADDDYETTVIANDSSDCDQKEVLNPTGTTLTFMDTDFLILGKVDFEKDKQVCGFGCLGGRKYVHDHLTLSNVEKYIGNVVSMIFGKIEETPTFLMTGHKDFKALKALLQNRTKLKTVAVTHYKNLANLRSIINLIPRHVKFPVQFSESAPIEHMKMVFDMNKFPFIDLHTSQLFSVDCYIEKWNHGEMDIDRFEIIMTEKREMKESKDETKLYTRVSDDRILLHKNVEHFGHVFVVLHSFRNLSEAKNQYRSLDYRTQEIRHSKIPKFGRYLPSYLEGPNKFIDPPFLTGTVIMVISDVTEPRIANAPCRCEILYQDGKAAFFFDASNYSLVEKFLPNINQLRIKVKGNPPAYLNRESPHFKSFKDGLKESTGLLSISLGNYTHNEQHPFLESFIELQDLDKERVRTIGLHLPKKVVQKILTCPRLRNAQFQVTGDIGVNPEEYRDQWKRGERDISKWEFYYERQVGQTVLDNVTVSRLENGEERYLKGCITRTKEVSSFVLKYLKSREV